MTRHCPTPALLGAHVQGFLTLSILRSVEKQCPQFIFLKFAQ